MTRLRHGKAKAPIYGIWSAMMRRCFNPQCKAYPDYGGRGITVCNDWRIFDGFYADMGDPPPGLTLDRIDNDGPYEPGNCRWATRRDQCINRRTTKFYEVDGVSKPLCDWAVETGLTIGTIWARLNKGWPVDRAIKTPKITKRKGIARGERLRDHAWSEPNPYERAA